VHDGTADRRDEHRGRHTRLVAGVVASQQVGQPVHHAPERFVLGEEPDDDGIAQDGAHRATTLDGEVDDPGDEHLARPRRSRLGFGGIEHRFQPGQLGLGHGEDDLVLGPELVVDRRLRHADLLGDHRQRRPPDTLLGEQVESGGHHAGLRSAGRRRAGLAAGDDLHGIHTARLADPLPTPSRSTTLTSRSTTRRPAIRSWMR
jgi:hypothetical protein